ncbi:MAG: HNH endonuclease signature motif containing protein, partial [Acidimicrobiales bacterium]
LAVAELRRLVLGADSEILDLGRAVRDFPRKLKQAVIAATRGRCTVPGCDAKAHWLQIDHIKPWARGGLTDLANAQPMCGFHNKQKSDQPPDPDPGRDPDPGCDPGLGPGPGRDPG